MEGGCTDDVADAAGEAGSQVTHGGKNGGSDGETLSREKPSQREIADLLLPDRPQ